MENPITDLLKDVINEQTDRTFSLLADVSDQPEYREFLEMIEKQRLEVMAMLDKMRDSTDAA